MGRNVPVVSVLPIMAFDTNTTTWTDLIRPTLDAETSFITNVTRAAIIVATVAVAVALLVFSLSPRLLRKWNQRNYTKVSENFELNEQRRQAGQSLPSILKKKYLSKDGGSRSDTRHHGEVLFEDDDGYGDDEAESYDEEVTEEVDRSKGPQRSLLSNSQSNSSSKPPRRVRIDDRVEQRVLEPSDEDGQELTDDENEEGQVVVRMPPSGSSERSE